jgi:PAS domain S-box-containing protein
MIFVGPGLLALAAAIEERKSVEDALRLSDRRFRLVLEATRDAIYERDLRSDALWWSGNGLPQRGYGWPHSPATYAALVDLVHPDDRQRVALCHACALDSHDQPWECEYRLRRADGSFAHVHEQGLVVRDVRGCASLAIGALDDVTERRDVEELSQRLAHASRLSAMGELTASIAHEINQPMSAILSNVDAAEMLLDAGDAGRDELRQVLEDIRSDNLRASEVIQHIRGLAKKRGAERERFDVNEVVRGVLRIALPMLKQRGVEAVPVLGDVPPVVADRIHVQQVLLNLLLNAMDAMSEKPASARRIVVATAVHDADSVVVSVRDAGHGIAAGQLDRIFDSFFTTKKSGMGLGLSIARSLVEAHGGRIWAENHAEGGATFRFTVPSAAAHEESSR